MGALSLLQKALHYRNLAENIYSDPGVGWCLILFTVAQSSFRIFLMNLGLRTPLPVVAFWVYLPGQNDTHSRIAVLFLVHMVRFNRLGDPKKSPNGRGVSWRGLRFAVLVDFYQYYNFRSPDMVLDRHALKPTTAHPVGIPAL